MTFRRDFDIEVPAPGQSSYDVLMVLNYYAPYVSGLSDSAKILAESLVASGWKVAVATSHHDANLPRREIVNGVEIHRSRVIARVSKGVISPAFPLSALYLARKARLTHLHLPMLEAGPIAALVGRNAKLISTYYCDINLPPGTLNRAAIRAIDISARLAIHRSTAITVLSHDYAGSSRLSDILTRERSTEVPPPCIDRSGGRPSFREGPGTHVGFVGRMVEEKGVEYLVQGFRRLRDPAARLLLAGDYERVAGGSVVARARQAAGGDPRIRLLGFLPDEALADFYASLDIFALPSVNSLEAFGIVQVEAMMAGVPVITTDLPGVRLPVQQTGFGVIVRPRDAAAIANAITALRDRPRSQMDTYRRIVPGLPDLTFNAGSLRDNSSG